MAALKALLLVVVAFALGGVLRQPQPAYANPLSGVAAVSAGLRHTCALTTAGGVECWGDNSSGELGDGTTVSRRTPVEVSGLGVSMAAISAGGVHTCALTTTGGVKCWGASYGPTPVDVPGLNGVVAAVSAGGGHDCVLTTAGGLKCWGSNVYGQLGDGTTTSRTTPVDVSGLASGVASVSAGYRHTCAVTTGGGVRCWGHNIYGQLGDGTTTGPELCSGDPCSKTPIDVSGLTTGVAAVSAGTNGTCSRTTSSGVKCWGQICGNGSYDYCPTPVDVCADASCAAALSGVGAVSSGSYHACALTTAGGAKCWGVNFVGQLGNGQSGYAVAWPVDVSGLASGVTAISAGQDDTCAVTAGGAAKCWGWNYYGQLGDGTTTNRSTPTDVLALVKSVGGIAELPAIQHAPSATADSGSRSGTRQLVIGFAAGAIALGAVAAAYRLRRRNRSRGSVR